MATRETDLSEVVVNSRMNRGRGLSGVNSYQRELRGFDIVAFLQRQRERFPERAIRWFDFGCGEGHALREMAKNEAAPDRLEIVGMDLLLPEEMIAVPEHRQLILQEGDVTEHLPEGHFDLITGIHALHYIKDKLGLLERLYPLLTADGSVLLAHLDPANVRAESDKSGTNRLWNRVFRQAQRQVPTMRYRDGLLRIERSGAADDALSFQTCFVDCRVSDGPNRSGMIVVDSWYK